MKSEPSIALGPVVTDRVRWSDVDKMDVVYFGRYLRFQEAAEAEFFRMIGWSYDRCIEEGNVWVARVHLGMDFRAPARLDDEISCRAVLTKLGGSSIHFAFPIELTRDGTRLVDVTLVLACLGRESYKAVPIPEGLAAALRSAG